MKFSDYLHEFFAYGPIKAAFAGGPPPRFFRRHSCRSREYRDSMRGPWKHWHGWRGWEESGPWSGMPGGPRARFFEFGEVRLAILSLLKDSPKHGYQLIKELTERS